MVLAHFSLKNHFFIFSCSDSKIFEKYGKSQIVRVAREDEHWKKNFVLRNVEDITSDSSRGGRGKKKRK